MHWGIPQCDTELFAQFNLEAQRIRTYTIDIADDLDAMRRTFLARVLGIKIDEDSHKIFDELMLAKAQDYKKHAALALRKGTCLGIFDGNHNYEWMTDDYLNNIHRGETMSHWLARSFDIPYMGSSGYITLDIDVDGQKDKLVILASHGAGASAGSIGADLNKMEKMDATFDADIIITGHTHRRASYTVSKIGLNDTGDGMVGPKTRLYKAGSFLRAYSDEGDPSYAERKLMRPLDLGWEEILISYHYKDDQLIRRITSSRYDDTDIH